LILGVLYGVLNLVALVIDIRNIRFDQGLMNFLYRAKNGRRSKWMPVPKTMKGLVLVLIYTGNLRIMGIFKLID
jgi:hypothetical protein